MNANELLNDDQKAALQELINISFGLANALISDMIETPTHMPIPEVDVVEMENLRSYIDSKLDKKGDYYVTVQLFRDNMNGEAVFLMGADDSQRFTKILLGEEETENENEVKACVLELTNIMVSACVGKFMEMLNRSILFHPPTIERYSWDSVIDYDEKSQYSQVIIIETTLHLPNIDVKGWLFILTHAESFIAIRDSLDSFMDEL